MVCLSARASSCFATETAGEFANIPGSVLVSRLESCRDVYL